MPATPNRKADLFRRAHELRRWNKGNGEFGTLGFGYWLGKAWAELRAGNPPSFSPEAVKARKIQALRDDYQVEMNRGSGWSMQRINEILVAIAALEDEPTPAPAAPAITIKRAA